MTFGKRFSVHNDRAPAVVERTCARCYGTGRVRERGTRMICKACTGSGRTVVSDYANDAVTRSA